MKRESEVRYPVDFSKFQEGARDGSKDDKGSRERGRGRGRGGGRGAAAGTRAAVGSHDRLRDHDVDTGAADVGGVVNGDDVETVMGADAASLRLKGDDEDVEEEEAGSEPSTGRSRNNDQLVDSGLEPSPRREKPSDKGKGLVCRRHELNRTPCFVYISRALTRTFCPPQTQPPPTAVRRGVTALAASPGSAAGGRTDRGRPVTRRRCPSRGRCSSACGSKGSALMSKPPGTRPARRRGSPPHVSPCSRYHLERRIFHELLELKRLQIRAGRANEQVLVKRLVDDYRRAGMGVGLTPFAGTYTFRSFEKYLYGKAQG